jgi:outer membrane protein
MKKRHVVRPLLTVMLACLLAASLSANALAQEGKVGVVDMIKVIDQSKQGKKAMDEMAAKLKVAKSDLQKRETELVSLKGQIEKNAMTMSAEALAQKERQYQDKLLQYQRKLEDYQYQLSAKNDEINKMMLTLMKDVIEKIGSSGGYVLILEKTASGVLYRSDTVDLTNEVIQELNKK